MVARKQTPSSAIPCGPWWCGPALKRRLQYIGTLNVYVCFESLVGESAPSTLNQNLSGSCYQFFKHACHRQLSSFFCVGLFVGDVSIAHDTLKLAKRFLSRLDGWYIHCLAAIYCCRSRNKNADSAFIVSPFYYPPRGQNNVKYLTTHYCPGI